MPNNPPESPEEESLEESLEDLLELLRRSIERLKNDQFKPRKYEMKVEIYN